MSSEPQGIAWVQTGKRKQLYSFINSICSAPAIFRKYNPTACVRVCNKRLSPGNACSLTISANQGVTDFFLKTENIYCLSINIYYF
jgi:hypothetical protein